MMHDHVETLNKKITALSDALAHLGRGTDLKELILIIKNPGWTTPAEFTLVSAIVESMQMHVHALDKLQGDLLSGSKLVLKK